MRKLSTFFVAALIVLISMPTFAQDKPASPKAEAAGKAGNASVKINYSQPSARGRKIMGELVPFGQVWRTGANEATVIEFDKAVQIEGKDLPAGQYALFTIPGENEWTIIFNKDTKQWGAYNYKQSDDVLRVTVKPAKTDQFVETLTIAPDKDKVTIKWENTQVAFKVK
jgi:hypothetical protein